MKIPFDRTKLTVVSGLLVAGAVLVADGTRFSDFTPLASSAGPTADESRPITFANPDFFQQSIVSRQAQLAALRPNTGSFDMITANETGGNKSKYLFTVFETGTPGVQRHNLESGETDTIWMSPGPNLYTSFDASYWTPWGTYITAEESWSAPGSAGYPTRFGRLFELTNPIEAPGIYTPVTAQSNAGAEFLHRNVIPRVSHEGIQFDNALNMYFIDELNGGSLYKYTPLASWGEIKSGRAGYFDAGQTFVLRVGTGTTPNATGAYTWVPITNRVGAPLPGAVVITDPTGVTSIDGRATTDVAAFKGTDYQRPEDMQIQTVGENQYLYVTTTTTHETYRLDLQQNVITVYADRNTIDLATGIAVGSALANPDNLAVDHDGNIYIIEDREGGSDDDIWLARDLNGDGDLKDPGEGIGRWASNGAVGSEFTGLYFDPKDKRRAWVNIQHPSTGNDRTIEITIP
jgi:uncharacterized protein